MASKQLLEIILKAKDEASSVADKVDNNLKKIGNTSNLLGRVPGLNTLSQKLSSVGNTIKGKFSGALDKARAKLKQLGAEGKSFSNSLGFLKSALSMTIGMIGYDLVNGIMESAKASINAAAQVEYFGQRLNKMSGQAHLSTEQFNKFKGELGDLQKEFRKVDMTAVGATAEELAVKMNLPAEKLGDLTRLTAVMSSTFVKEGRSQEDAVLAVSDALDGQFRRLQEIGISQDKLKENGWTGNLEDQESLMDALNKTMQEMGYEQTAKDITNLDEAMTALNIAGGQLLQKVLVPLTPVIISVVDALLRCADAITPVIEGFTNMPDWAQLGLGITAFGLALVALSGTIKASLVPALADATMAALDFAAAMLANPLTWVVIALAAVAVAVYEVGKAFGWWDSVGGMLSAVWAGIQRLWSAFINHPDVQGLINAITSAWKAMQPYIQSIIKWVKSFFKASGKKDFDIVRTLINAISVAWRAMTMPIRTVINVVRALWNAIKGGYNTAKTTINNIGNAFRGLPSRISGAVGGVTNAISAPFTRAYQKIIGIVDKIKSKASSIGNISLPSFWGGEDLEFYGGSDLTYTNDKLTVDMNQNINLSLDLKNVPSTMDERALAGMINETLDSKEFISRLVNNPDFQSLDGKVKQRIVLKSNRANGRGV